MSMKLSFLLLGSLSIMVGSQVSGDPLQRSFSVNNQSAYKLAKINKLTILEKHKYQIFSSQVHGCISLVSGLIGFLGILVIPYVAKDQDQALGETVVVGAGLGLLNVYFGMIELKNANKASGKANKIEEWVDASRKINRAPLPYNFTTDTPISGPDNKGDGTPFSYDFLRNIKPTDKL